ncbi:glutamine--fructose-6-phosphate transaminase (isomerizing) [Acidianus sulfidivorans JP7]|uniref:Glutamine--fructose-6-phosphate aminotransferase [isomerizing] n=1 Tax=Acidianus sulfidivorans JP7 TaxID=619593 RepID=A0A2U9IP66_9CREN|nr:glutamine--fructose-6-phosphate transaminase (isomerizing) [Acidianus sulfidivorans]AWR97839.1 glutamine--fructose-6-phosphate transaminase (isomerizing) [Acidianus sulfidivorans JP7]
MCGIIGIIAKDKKENLATITVQCLERLEYRGYDSVGIAAIKNNQIEIRKAKGKLEEVVKKLNILSMSGDTFLGHTRWATHGEPTDYNAHPHTDCTNSIAVIHNGTIRNFNELKEELISLGHTFKSETDTEVIPHLIEEFKKRGMDNFTAFKSAVNAIQGTYAILAIIKDEENKIYFAKKDNPLVIGIADKMNFVSSDIPSFLPYTNKIVILIDGDIGYITDKEVYIENFGKPVKIEDRIKIITWDASAASKEGYEHYMLKEIHESPIAVEDTISGMISEIDKIKQSIKLINSAKRIIITAAGTSYHAGLIFSILLQREGYNAIPLIASEYYNLKTSDEDVILAISQSGETLDVIQAIKRFKQNNSPVISLTNIIESAIARESDIKLYTRAGPEIGVAATKTFTSQVAALLLLYNFLTQKDYSYLSKAKDVIRYSLNYQGEARLIGEELATKTNAYYLGRGLSLPLAMEGALKIKEIAYIHAEAYPAGESKHGPIALVEKGFPVIFINDGELTEDLQNNVQEMKARKAITYGISVNKKINTEKEIFLNSNENLSIFAIIPIIQLIAYYAAVKRGNDPDKPRNLAKTVTVE